MSVCHSYGLDWVDEDALFEVTKASFSKVLQPANRKPLPPDPFTLLAHAVLTGESLATSREFELKRAINKTISGNVGYWHQRVLGLAPNWVETGASGGSIDLRTADGYVHPIFKKPVLAEVKNRFNTIKASDEKNLWDRLDNLARANDAVAYVFQIVPKTPEPYDRAWKVSGRNEKPIVRVCDGVSAYSLVFGHQPALWELYMALPKIFADITGSPVDYNIDELTELFAASMPAQP